MSSEATAVEPRRTSDPKKPVSASTASTPANNGNANAAAAVPSAPDAAPITNGATAAQQGLAAALAQAPESSSADPRKNRDASNQIDRQLEDDSKKFKKECKILLLGEL